MEGSEQNTAVMNADSIVVDRMQTYGHPKENFDRLAVMWKAYLYAKFGAKLSLDAEDVAQMMILVKQARLMNGYHADSVEDQAGYAKCHHLVMQNNAKEIDWNVGNPPKEIPDSV